MEYKLVYFSNVESYIASFIEYMRANKDLDVDELSKYSVWWNTSILGNKLTLIREV